MTEDKKYNGWTNYETWRINLEIFDGYDPEGQPVEPDCLEELAHEIVLSEVDDKSLAYSYAYSFMQRVNWHEIAEGINEGIEDDDHDQDAADLAKEQDMLDEQEEN